MTVYTKKDEPVAELVAHTEGNLSLIKITKRSATYLALGTPLYTRPDNSELRQAAEEACGEMGKFLDGKECYLDDALINLRDALEGRHE
jgi:hypothetical protein